VLAPHNSVDAPQPVLTYHASQTINGIPGFPASYIGILGSWQSDLAGAQGTTTNFTDTTDLAGHLSSTYARVPAIWLIKETSGPCNGLYNYPTVRYAGYVVGEVCVYSDGPFTASPSSWYNNNPPDSVTITGSGISTSAMTYVLDPNGNVLYTQEGSDGTTVVLDALSLPVGTSHVAVMNPNGDGSYTAIGTVSLVVHSCGTNCL